MHKTFTKNYFNLNCYTGKIPVIFHICLFFACFYLFYNMSYGYIPSDFLAHLQSAKKNTIEYSLNFIIYKFIYLFPFGHHILASVYLSSIVTVLPITISYLFTVLNENFLHVQIDLPFVGLLCFPIIFMTSFVIPVFFVWYYKNTFGINPWHNPTIIAMKLFVLLALAEYVKIRKSYDENLVIDNDLKKSFVKFSIFLFIATLAKPSFMLGFCPAVVIILFVEMLNNIKNKLFWQKSIFMALSFIPAGLVVIFQNFLVFHSTKSDNSVIIAPFKVFLHGAEKVWLRFPVFLMFPISVFIAYAFMKKKNLLKNIIYKDVFVNWFVSLLIFLLLAESGNRMFHGNFGWGLINANFLLYIMI